MPKSQLYLLLRFTPGIKKSSRRVCPSFGLVLWSCGSPNRDCRLGPPVSYIYVYLRQHFPALVCALYFVVFVIHMFKSLMNNSYSQQRCNMPFLQPLLLLVWMVKGVPLSFHPTALLPTTAASSQEGSEGLQMEVFQPGPQRFLFERAKPPHCPKRRAPPAPSKGMDKKKKMHWSKNGSPLH